MPASNSAWELRTIPAIVTGVILDEDKEPIPSADSTSRSIRLERTTLFRFRFNLMTLNLNLSY
jgi:hypothetical protein